VVGSAEKVVGEPAGDVADLIQAGNGGCGQFDVQESEVASELLRGAGAEDRDDACGAPELAQSI
jgi:hypothetical protein